MALCQSPKGPIVANGRNDRPWIAYKVLGAGAIHPQQGFRYAYHNGADFICVGMYDFQVVDDVNLAASILQNGIKRERAWRA